MNYTKYREEGVFMLLLFILYSGCGYAQDSLNDIQFFQTKTFDLDGIEIADSLGVEQEKMSNPINYNSTANIDRVLENLDGVQLIKRGAFALDPQINGLSGGQVAITIDGMRMFGACTDKMDPITSYVEPVNLDKAEVSDDAGSSMLGANVGGLLSLKTRKAKFNDTLRIGGELNGGYFLNNSGSDINGGLNVGGKKVAVRFNAAYRNHPNYRAGGDSTIRYTQYKKLNTSVNVAWRMTDNWILRTDYLFDEANDIGYAALSMDVSVARTHIGAMEAIGYSVSKNIERLQFKLYANNIYHEMDDSKRPDEEVAMRMDMPGWSNTFGGFANVSFVNWRKHKFDLRVDYYNNFRRAEMTMYDPLGGPDMFMLTWPNVRRNSIGLSVNDKIEWNKKTDLTISLRLEGVNSKIEDEFGQKQITGFGFTGQEEYTHLPFSAGFTIQRKISKDLNIKLTGVSSSRNPTVSEMYGFYLFNKEDGYDYIGLPNISMEKSNRLGLSMNKKSDQLNWYISGSYNHLTDFIYGVLDSTLVSMTIGGRGVKYYENLPFTQIVSATAGVRYSLLKFFELSSRFNYTWGERNNGVPLAQIQPLNNVTQALFTKRSWFAILEVESGTAQQLIDPDFGEDSTPSWAVLNMRTGKKWELKNGISCKLKAGIENVFDQYYYRHLDWGNVPRMGRNFYLNLGLRF